MKKKLLLFLCSLGIASNSIAQQLSPSVLAAGGGIASAPTMTLEWTLGESVIETHTAPERLYTQGFHQPLLHISEQTDKTALFGLDAAYSFTVAPNPVASALTIGINSPEDKPLQLQLVDLNGRQYNLPDIPPNTQSTQIDMTSFPGGTYLLHIGKVGGSRLKAYKIVKTQ